MKKKLALSMSAALIAALCIPAIAFGVGGAQSNDTEDQKMAAQTPQSASYVVEESAPVQANPAEEVAPENQSVADGVVEPDVPVAPPMHGYNYVDNDGDGICDNYSNGNCTGAGSGVCDGTGANGNGGYGNRGGNGQGASNGYCDGSGREAHQGGHHGNGHQRR